MTQPAPANAKITDVAGVIVDGARVYARVTYTKATPKEAVACKHAKLKCQNHKGALEDVIKAQVKNLDQSTAVTRMLIKMGPERMVTSMQASASLICPHVFSVRYCPEDTYLAKWKRGDRALDRLPWLPFDFSELSLQGRRAEMILKRHEEAGTHLTEEDAAAMARAAEDEIYAPIKEREAKLDAEIEDLSERLNVHRAGFAKASVRLGRKLVRAKERGRGVEEIVKSIEDVEDEFDEGLSDIEADMKAAIDAREEHADDSERAYRERCASERAQTTVTWGELSDVEKADSVVRLYATLFVIAETKIAPEGNPVELGKYRRSLRRGKGKKKR